MTTIKLDRRFFASISLRLTLCAAVCALAVSSTPLAAGVIQVSNLNQASGFTASVSLDPSVAGILIAGKFTTDAHGYALAGAQAALDNSGDFGLGTYEARLYSDAGSVPGSLLVTFDNHPTLASGNSQIVDFTTGSNLALDALTSYWLGIRNTTGGRMGWKFTASDAEISPGAWTIDDAASALSFNLGTSWSDTSGNFASFVPLLAISVVPEPATFVLGGLGIVGLLAYARRRKWTATATIA